MAAVEADDGCCLREQVSEEGAMNRIIVTGATSMLGVALIETALEHGAEVYAVVRVNTKRLERLPASEKLHLVYADLSELSELDTSLIGSPCDVLYHFAWAGTSKSERDDPEIQDKNIGFTLEAVRLAHRLGCRLFVGAGSQAEYGPVDGLIDSSTKYEPVISYGAAKYAAGILSRKLCSQLGILHAWGRVFSVYGRYDNHGTMLDYAIRQFLNEESAAFSSGRQEWDYLNERDAGRLFYQIGEKTAQNETYLIASGQSRPLREFVLELAEVMNAENLCSFASEEAVRPAGLRVDPSATFRALGIKPEVSFREGITEMVNAYRAHADTGSGVT